MSTSEEKGMTAESQLALGQRAMAFRKFADASEHFSHAVELLSATYGELEPEVGDALMFYGKALLRNAIANSAVLGGEAQQKEVEAPTQNAVAGPSTGVAPTAQSLQFHFGGDADDDEEEEEEEQEEVEEQDDEFETAFNILDMARATWAKVKGVEAQKKTAECYRLLGDTAMECERFEEAVQEYTSSLDLLSPLLEPHDRSLSELHMLMALALDNVPEAVSRAVEHAEKSKQVLILRLMHLHGLGEKRSEVDDREVLDIKELMADVDNKIEDLKIVAEEAPKSATDLALDAFLATAAAKGISTSGVINNLNSLVKKKKAVVAPAVEDEGNVEASGSGSKRKGDEVDGSEEKKSKFA